MLDSFFFSNIPNDVRAGKYHQLFLMGNAVFSVSLSDNPLFY